ncbi:hypothetical protein N9Y17_02785 [Gammaproteobacteria bacterium]|nr:hypothetical protein [Gammaproteobacteria bacterium]
MALSKQVTVLSLRAMESQRRGRVVSSRSSLFWMNKMVDTQYNGFVVIESEDKTAIDDRPVI